MSLEVTLAVRLLALGRFDRQEVFARVPDVSNFPE
jgi:hypothetical protein